MGRRRTHRPLLVRLNGRQVGRLERAADGATRFAYAPEWLDWEHRFAVSLSLPLTPGQYTGATVKAVFDNLLPDRDAIRARVAERTGAEGTDYYSLLAAIGRDCVGALQFVPEGEEASPPGPPRGTPWDDEAIEAMLANLARTPVGLDRTADFRISVAGAQEKTALLRHDGRWFRPDGTTATTHILKPQIGQVPTARGLIDPGASVDKRTLWPDPPQCLRAQGRADRDRDLRLSPRAGGGAVRPRLARRCAAAAAAGGYVPGAGGAFDA